MKHALIWIFILALGWAVPAMAQTDVSAPVVKMLQDEGYMVSEVRRTWLGRIRSEERRVGKECSSPV